ncbi:AlpA family phage regulatory protein [Rhodoferax sp. GW822-FHT02A01]|uniref:helix-turn-helix transcriptional regulator n=1 Tax=Rhodoferax sp. GW822-FHT02A01 TaxID=3141537 RepID=UPI00315DE18D
MQKRLKASIWPTAKSVPVEPDPLSPLEKINQLRTEMPQVGYVRQALLIPGILPISPATLWRWVSIGKFPKPVKISSRITAWRVADVTQWLQSKG